jgi:hypothetical protein
MMLGQFARHALQVSSPGGKHGGAPLEQIPSPLGAI